MCVNGGGVEGHSCFIVTFMCLSIFFCTRAHVLIVCDQYMQASKDEPSNGFLIILSMKSEMAWPLWHGP